MAKRVKHRTTIDKVYHFYSDRLDLHATWDRQAACVDFEQLGMANDRELVHHISFLIYIRKEIARIQKEDAKKWKMKSK